MEKCFYCKRQPKYEIPAEFTFQATGFKSSEPIRVCDKHNDSCWRRINMIEFNLFLISIMIKPILIALIIIVIIRSVN